MVRQITTNLHSLKAPGLDGIEVVVLNNCGHELIYTYLLIFSICIIGDLIIQTVEDSSVVSVLPKRSMDRNNYTVSFLSIVNY